MRKYRARMIVVGIVCALLAVVVFPLVTMLLWNALVPSLFKGPSVSYAQALGLLILSHILLRGGRGWHWGCGGRHERWRKRFEEKLQSMSPEDRERFRDALGLRWKCDPDVPVEEKSPGPQGG